MGRWGEKVPAAVGTVADRFALLQLGALHLQGAFLPADHAGAYAIGTELLLAQGIGLLFQEGLEGALGKAGGGGTGDLLHGIQIDVEAGAVVAEGASGNDFAPAGGKVAEFLKFLGGEGASWHVASCLAVETKTRGKMAPVKVCPPTSQSKAVHDLTHGQHVRFLLIVPRSALYKGFGVWRHDPSCAAPPERSPRDDRGKESPSSPLDAGKEARPMRSHLVPVACLLVLGIAGSVTLSLIRGQEIKPPVPPAPRPGASVTAPVVAPGPPPLTVTVPGRSASSTRPAIDLARLEPLHRQMYL